MTRHAWLLIIGLWLLHGLLHAPVCEARDDWQLWLEQKWSVKLFPTVKWVGKTEERFRDNFDEFYTQLASTGLSWAPRRWLKLESGYHYQWTERVGARDLNENRIYLAATPTWSWGRVTVEDRNRLEFRHVNGVDDWRYRHRAKLGVKVGEGWYAVEPYVADEVFYGARAGEWARNRVSVGIGKALGTHLESDLYYLIESNRKGRDWEEFHVLGVSLATKW